VKAVNGVESPPGLDEQTLSLQTLLREAENDAVVTEHEYRNEQTKLDIYRKLHQGAIALRKKQVISELAYEESRTRLIKTEHRVEELKQRAKEFHLEVAIDQWKYAKTIGGESPLVELAKLYADLWQTRSEKLRAAELQAKAEYDYTSLVLQKNQALSRSRAVTLEAVLYAQRDFEEASTVWHLAKVLTEKNTRAYEASVAALKKIEQGDTRLRPLEELGL
jgi:hypothetical protein